MSACRCCIQSGEDVGGGGDGSYDNCYNCHFFIFIHFHVLRVCCIRRKPWSNAAGCRCCGHYTTIFDGKREQCLYVSGFNASALTALMMHMMSVADLHFSIDVLCM